MKSFERLMQEFLENAERHSEKYVDYTSKLSIATYNRSNDKYRKAVEQIDRYYPEKLSEFARCLNSENKDVKLACAWSILEHTHYSNDQAEMAWRVLNKYYEYDGDNLDKLVFDVRKKEWADGTFSTVYHKEKHHR